MKWNLALSATLVVTSFCAWAEQPIVGLITKTETGPFFVKMNEGAMQPEANVHERYGGRYDRSQSGPGSACRVSCLTTP